MKKILTLLTLIIAANGFAQLTKLQATLELDTSSSAFGQFIIYSLPDSTLIKGGYIDSTLLEADFDAKNHQQFYIKLSITGYQDSLIPFEIKGALVDIGVIKLNNDRLLNTVDIVYRKPEFQRTMDGISVNVQGTTLQTLNTLYDILIASPKLNSPDGESIEIIGKGAPLILIDRQPIITVDELRAVPASQVESVQIITNPSAKYKAQGSSNGVIEVYTRNFALEGYNMNISASGGISTQLKPSSMLNGGINVKRKKFSLSGYLGSSLNTSYSAFNSEGHTIDSTNQDLFDSTENHRQHTWAYYQLKSSYQINEKQRLTAGVRGNTSFGSQRNESSSNYFIDDVQRIVNVSSSDPSYLWLNNSAFVNYQLETDTNKSNLEINFNLINKISSDENTSINFYTNSLSGTTNNFDIKTESANKPFIGELRVNYEHNFDTTGWQLRTGLSFSQLINNQRYKRYNFIGADWLEDTIFSNTYNYVEQIGTIYAEVTKNWEKLSFRLGVTGEFTGLDGYSYSLEKQFIDSAYLIPFPSASLMFQPSNNVGLTLGYSAGIDRPQFSNYDPFIRYTDSLNISYGNPYLRPATSHTISLDMDLFYMYTLSFYVSKTFDPISTISFVDSSFTTISLPWNAQFDQSIGADISVPLQTDWLEGWNSLWFSYDMYRFTDEFNRDDFNNFNFGIYSYLNFKLPKDFMFMNQLHVMRWGSSDYTSNVQANWGVRLTKKFKEGDFQIYFDVDDIFPPKDRSTTYYGNYLYNSNGQYTFTSFRLGLYYKFGRLKQSTHIQESNAGQSGRI